MYVIKQTNTDAEPERDRPEEVISVQDLEEFRRLFWGWLESGQNSESLEAGGVGDLVDLALRARQWASLPNTKKGDAK